MGGGRRPWLSILKETSDDRGVIRNFMDIYAPLFNSHLETPHAEVKETQVPLKLHCRETGLYAASDCHLSSVLPFFVLVLGGRDTLQEFCVQALALSTSPPSFGP